MTLSTFQDGFTNLHDSPIRMFPKLVNLEETYSYSGTAQGGYYSIRGDFDFRTSDKYSSPWGSIEGIFGYQSSPYDTIRVNYFLVRGFGVYAIFISGQSNGYVVETTLLASSLNRSYTPKARFSSWDAESRYGRSSFVQDSWFGLLYDGCAPWTYLYKLGWVYTDTTNWDDFWFYSKDKGWCYTSFDVFPMVYVNSTKTWFNWDEL